MFRYQSYRPTKPIKGGCGGCLSGGAAPSQKHALVQKLNSQITGGRRPTFRSAPSDAPTILPGDSGVDEDPYEVDEKDTVGSHVKKRAASGFKKFVDKAGDVVSSGFDRLIPVIADQMINRILKSMEGKKGDERREVIEGGALMLHDVCKHEGLRGSRNKILPILDAHRKGHHKTTRDKLISVMV